MRLAYFSPLNPAPSGIGDYSKELLPHLAAHAELTLIVDGYTPTDPELGSFRVLHDRAYRARDFDLALYHLGNSPAHAYIYRRALSEPGVIVLHDLVLHHLIAWLTLNHGNAQDYIAAMRDPYGDDGARLAEREVLGLDALNRFDYPLSERVIRSARGVIAHSRYVADAVKRIAPHMPVAQIPHEMPDVALIAQDAARAQLKLLLDAPLIGTFGNLGPTKRTTILLDAFRTVLEQIPQARLLLIGASSPNFDAQGLIDLFSLRSTVQCIGHVPLDSFQTYMAAMDVCVNLRYPTAGETSGAVLRMMAQAKPVIVSRVGWFAELPDDAVAKVDVDDHEVEELAVTLTHLLRDAELRAAMGDNARSYILENCAVQDVANYYGEFLNAVLSGRAESRVFGKQKAESGRQKAESGKRKAEKRETYSAKRTTEIEIRNSKFQIPNSKFKDAVSTDWRDEVVRAYVALGLAQEDAVLENVARALVELGLNA